MVTICLKQNLKFLRERKGRTHADVAAMIGVGRSTYSGWENRGFEPPLQKLGELCDYFKVPEHILLRRTLFTIRESELRIIERSYKPEPLD